MIHYIGLDCHRKMAQACHMDPAGKIIQRGTAPATQDGLVAYASQHLHKEDVVALEASFYARRIAQLLTPFVSRVVVSNPMQTKLIAKSKKKTDKVDAKTLADLLRLNYLPEVWVPDPLTQIRRDLCVRRCTLVKERTRVKNRIHSVLAAALIPISVSDLFGMQGLEWLNSLKLTEYQREAIDSELRLLETLNAEIVLQERSMAKDAWADARVKLLVTLPGVSSVVAESLLAAIGNIERFPTPEQLASYFGLVPCVHQSGDKCYRGPITRCGNRTARAMLVQAAQNVAEHPGPLGNSFRRLLKRKNRNVAVCACARKLVVIAWYMLKNNEPYRYAQPQVAAAKLSKLRMAATCERLKPGPRKAAEPRADLPAGTRTRTIPSLPSVYEREGVPPALRPRQMAAAERRGLRDAGIAPYVRSIQKAATIVVKPAKKATKTEPESECAAANNII